MPRASPALHRAASGWRGAWENVGVLVVGQLAGCEGLGGGLSAPLGFHLGGAPAPQRAGQQCGLPYAASDLLMSITKRNLGEGVEGMRA